MFSFKSIKKYLVGLLITIFSGFIIIFKMRGNKINELNKEIDEEIEKAKNKQKSINQIKKVQQEELVLTDIVINQERKKAKIGKEVDEIMKNKGRIKVDL